MFFNFNSRCSFEYSQTMVDISSCQLAAVNKAKGTCLILRHSQIHGHIEVAMLII